MDDVRWPSATIDDTNSAVAAEVEKDSAQLAATQARVARSDRHSMMKQGLSFTGIVHSQADYPTGCIRSIVQQSKHYNC